MAILVEQEVKNNAQTIEEVTRWQVSHRAGSLPRAFSMEIATPEPAVIGPVDIHVAYNGSDPVPILEDAQVEARSGSFDPAGYKANWTGVDGAAPFVQLSPEKRIIYLAREYVDRHAKGYDWEFEKGDEQVTGYFWWERGKYTWPLIIPEVPSDEASQGTFEIVITQSSRSEILEDLTDRMGIQINDGLPPTPFRNAYVLETTDTYFEAIRQLAAVWNPLIMMHYDGNDWIMFLLDVEGGQTAPSGGYTLKQEKLQISTITRRKTTIVNRAMVSGAERENAYGYSALVSPYKPRKPITVVADQIIEREIENEVENAKSLVYSDDWADTNLTKIRKEYATDPGDYRNRILLREEVSVYKWDPVFGNTSSALTSKRITTYDYLDYTSAVAAHTEHWHRIQLPGDSLAQFRKIKTTKTEYGDYVQEAGETERNEVEEGMILYDYQPVGGVPKYVNPQAVQIAERNKTIVTGAQSAQSWAWAQIRRHMTRYDVEDAWRVRRDTVIFNNLDGTVETDQEYIPISYERRSGRNDLENRDRWDFQDDASIAEYGYRPKIELAVPDLKADEDDELAQELWDRIKRKSNSEIIETTVVLPYWLPAMLGEKATIDDAEVDLWDFQGGSFDLKILPGGEYYVSGIQHNFELSPEASRAIIYTTLTLKKTF